MIAVIERFKCSVGRNRFSCSSSRQPLPMTAWLKKCYIVPCWSNLISIIISASVMCGNMGLLNTYEALKVYLKYVQNECQSKK